MSANDRIQLSKNQFARLIAETDGMCPVCSTELLQLNAQTRLTALSQAAHIYPHSPTDTEKSILHDVPMLSDNAESLDNIIMLCPNCHTKFDHPRTREGYMEMYALKRQLIKRRIAREYYQKHSIEDDIISVLQTISNVDICDDRRKLSYTALQIKQKMSVDASRAVINLVLRDARDYYLPIREALLQVESDAPGKSDMIAKEVALFYSELKNQHLTQDEIYYAINEWLDSRTHRKYIYVTQFVTAFYIQNCEVFS
ncbi:MAG: HNH endonuclease [Oscillospiraceae bacterium]|nr:HNH endonuclease [Oscillospiraceae bacterium]